MTEVSRILEKIEGGDSLPAEELLSLVYDELRRMAAAKLAQEPPGITLQATALVHEAYVRLVDQSTPQSWDNRGHFFSAAAEAMRRILVERARRKKAEKHGGNFHRVEISGRELIGTNRADRILELNDALEVLGKDESDAAELVKLKVFAGCSVNEAGKLLGISRATAYRHWTFARAWLKKQMSTDDTQQRKEKEGS